MQRTADALCDEGCPFTGVLYGGLMKTPQGIRVIEFNARFGDPETEVVLPRLKSDIYDIFSAVADGRDPGEAEWHDFATLGIVLASKGYPGSYEKGYEITGTEQVDGVVYHMGTAIKEGRLVTSGGRVMIVVCRSADPEQARCPGARGGPENRLRESFLSIRYRYEGSFVFSEKIVIFVLRIPGWDG